MFLIFLFLCFKCGLCVNYYNLFIVFTIKKVNSFVVASLHQIEYKFTLWTRNIESKMSLKCVFLKKLNNFTQNSKKCFLAHANWNVYGLYHFVNWNIHLRCSVSNKLNKFIKNTNICEFALANILHKSFDHMNIKVQYNDYTSLFNGTLITFLFTKVHWSWSRRK